VLIVKTVVLPDESSSGKMGTLQIDKIRYKETKQSRDEITAYCCGGLRMTLALPVVSEGNISPLHVYDQQPMYFSANTLG
jgi:hypothetical protein